MIFLFILVKDKPVFLICHQAAALAKKGNLEHHHITSHPKFSENYPPKSALQTSKISEDFHTMSCHLDNLRAEFDRCFHEMHKMEDIEVFSLPNGVDMEIIELQNNTELQARANDSHFWGLVNREKFLVLSSCMKIIKSKHRTCLTDKHLSDCMRLCVSNYEPNYSALCDAAERTMNNPTPSL
uniref:Uncharacterized protein n=1 Tax=Mastacembelus armatus TaxID=205130 RepID=A0A3Q3KYD7_9TELE